MSSSKLNSKSNLHLESGEIHHFNRETCACCDTHKHDKNPKFDNNTMFDTAAEQH